MARLPKLERHGNHWTIRKRQHGSHFRVNVCSADTPPNEARKALVKLLAADTEPSSSMSFGTLIDFYIANEMPQRFSTSKSYQSRLKNYVRPKWGAVPIGQIDALDVRSWIQGLDLAPKSKTHIKSLMFLLYETAMLHKWYPQGRNPIDLIKLRGSSKKTRKPRILTAAEFRKLVSGAKREPLHTLILLAGSLGLRRSELFGLKWSDFDFINGSLKLQRAVVEHSVDDLKTEASSKPVPLDPKLVAAIMAWKAQCQFTVTDWVFGSGIRRDLPLSPAAMLDYQLKPLAKSLGLGEIGWHDFRHSYRTWLSQTGAAIEVQKDLMRHEAIATTMDVYGEVVSEDKRRAHGKVVSLLMN